MNETAQVRPVRDAGSGAVDGRREAVYVERRCALRWPLVTWGLGLPGALAAALSWVIVFGGSHAPAVSVISALMPPGIGVALIGCGMLYRNWPTRIRIDEAGVSIGTVGSRRATARRPTVTHQNWGLFTSPWPSVRYVMVVTDPARIREIKKSPPYWTLSNRWVKPREMTRCMAGVLTAPWIRAALVIGVEHEGAGVVSPELRPARFFANYIAAPRFSALLTADLALEWVAPTRNPDELRAFLAAIGR